MNWRKLFSGLSEALWWRRTCKAGGPEFIELIKLHNDLTGCLCRECRWFERCRSSGICAQHGGYLDQAKLQWAREAAAALDRRAGGRLQR